MDRIKYTPQGFSYVDITSEECIAWGGYCICNGCNNISNDLKLVYILNDTYCQGCFDEWLERAKKYSKDDIEYDLAIQKKNHIDWYSAHIKL